MLTLKKVKQHDSFNHEVMMSTKINSWITSDLEKTEVITSDLMSDKFNDDAFALKISNMEIHYDTDELKYLVWEEHYHAGDYWTPPDVDVEVIAEFSTFPKALEFVLQKIVTKRISDYMESEYENHMDSLPQMQYHAA